jgi:hypothetical protein
VALRQAKALAAWPKTTAAKAAPDAAIRAFPVGKLSPGEPAGGHQGDDEGGHLHHGVQGGAVVDAVAGHGDDVASGLQGAGDAQLVLGYDPGQDHA